MRMFFVLSMALLLLASAAFAENISRAGNPDPAIVPVTGGTPFIQGSRAGEVLFVEAPGQTGFGPATKPDPRWVMYLDSTLGPGNYDWYGPINDTGDGPTVDTMLMYDLVIWNTYDWWWTGTAYPSVASRNNMASYMDQGGKVWFIGQDANWSTQGAMAAWLLSYFEVQAVTDDVINGVSPITCTGLNYLAGFSYTNTTDFQANDFYADGLTVTANGQIVTSSSGYNINSAKNDGTAAYWTNDLRSITPNSTPIAIVDSMLKLFGIGGGGDYCDTITFWNWGNIESGINYGDPPEWMAMAIKLTQDELSPYTGRYIRNVIFQLRAGTNPANDAMVIILGDSAAGDTLAIVPFTVTGDSGWYTVPLYDDTILIAPTDTFWVMVGFTYASGNYPFPCNTGSLIAQKSDWAWTNSGGWEYLSFYGLNYGWCLAVTTCPQNSVEEEIIGSPIYPFDVRAVKPIGRTTSISFSSPYLVSVNVNVFDITGRIVENLFTGSVQGERTFSFTSDVSGTYFYQVNAAGVNYTGKLTIID